jgi:hypothetical protein
VAAPEAPRRCKACDRTLEAPGDIGWECECGVIVCSQEECVSDFFRFVGGGEATRCLSCGAVL